MRMARTLTLTLTLTFAHSPEPNAVGTPPLSLSRPDTKGVQTEAGELPDRARCTGLLYPGDPLLTRRTAC